MEKRYVVYEEVSRDREIVLETDDKDEAIARYRKCYGSGSGKGGVWDRQGEGYKWIM